MNIALHLAEVSHVCFLYHAYGRNVSVRDKLKENLLFYVELPQNGTYTERRGTNRLRYSLTICIDFVFLLRSLDASCQADGNREITEFPCEVDKE